MPISARSGCWPNQNIRRTALPPTPCFGTPVVKNARTTAGLAPRLSTVDGDGVQSTLTYGVCRYGLGLLHSDDSNFANPTQALQYFTTGDSAPRACACNQLRIPKGWSVDRSGVSLPRQLCPQPDRPCPARVPFRLSGLDCYSA